MFPEPVAVAGDLDHDGMMQQLVQERGGKHSVAEHLTLFADAAVGRQDDRTPQGQFGVVTSPPDASAVSSTAWPAVAPSTSVASSRSASANSGSTADSSARCATVNALGWRPAPGS